MQDTFRQSLNSGFGQPHLVLLRVTGVAHPYLLKKESTRFLEITRCNKGHLSRPLVFLLLICSDLVSKVQIMAV